MLSSEKALIIAEAGVNHNGSVALAHKLIDVARAAGADVVKFQTFSSHLLLRQDTPLVEYQKKVGSSNMYEMVQKLELSHEEFAELKKHCDTVGIVFLSTAFDLLSLDFLVDRLGMSMVKIPSGEVLNVPLLRGVGRKGITTILSTGMCTLEEIKFGVDTLIRASPTGGLDIAILQCTTAYPAPEKDVHLRSMIALRQEFGRPVGLSDHSEGILASCGAVALGATVIEKHFTIDKSLPGPDHQASVDSEGLKQLVSSIRTIERMMGSPEKGILSVEKLAVKTIRRSLVTRRAISKGEIVGEDDLVALRPEDGIPVRDWDKVVGNPAWADFRAGEILQWPRAAK